MPRQNSQMIELAQKLNGSGNVTARPSSTSATNTSVTAGTASRRGSKIATANTA